MAQLGGDLLAPGERALRVDEAAQLLLSIPCVGGVETVALTEAEGRVLAEPLFAPIDLPSFDNSAVDGYAVKFADLAVESETTLRLEARAAAGHPFGGAPPDGCAVRIFTGAVMPEGMDTVFMQEDCRILETGAVALPHGLK